MRGIKNIKIQAIDTETKESTVFDQSRPGVYTYVNLKPATTYNVVVNGDDSIGEKYEQTWQVTTSKDVVENYPSVAPLTDSVVGVGHPITIYFDEPVDNQYRKNIVDNLQVTFTQNNKPAAYEGHWGWVNDKEVTYRGESWLPANADVVVNLNLNKTQTNVNDWVMVDRQIKFRTGKNRVIEIDNKTLQANVKENNQIVKTIDVSMGKQGFTTRSGIKTIMSKERTRRMNSDTVGIGGSEAYDLEVPYALRLTNSGEFLHGAPWSEYAQGVRNVSHGCTNVSLADGKWLYENAQIGDVVVTKGTNRNMETTNGTGGVWNWSWDEWQTK